MDKKREPKPHRGNITPQDLADPSKHQHEQIFESENRPTGRNPGEGEPAEGRFERGEDMKAAGERTMGRDADADTTGNPAGPDTTGAVAHPAELNRPGASTKLGGTPGALSTGSGGRGGGTGR